MLVLSVVYTLFFSIELFSGSGFFDEYLYQGFYLIEVRRLNIKYKEGSCRISFFSGRA
jgi:hypothetical protein